MLGLRHQESKDISPGLRGKDSTLGADFARVRPDNHG